MWFIHTLVNAIVVYGISLVLYATQPLSDAARWIAAVLFWLLVIYNACRLYVFVTTVVKGQLDAWHSLLRLLDLYIAICHGLAGWAMSLWILDQSVGKTSFFVGVDAAKDAYTIYVGDFLMTTILLFNTAGFGDVRPSASTVGGTLWAIVTSFTGLFMIGFVLVIVLRGFKKRVPLDRKTRDMSQNIRAQVLPTFRVDWNGRTQHTKLHDPANLKNVRLPTSKMIVRNKAK